ncbi:hypothetical protein AB0N88_06135 [Streptomyces sp. NPDC093516]|uniref:hypothetical protein n=1 Tax=Streptomyces sp. NPDC093516 TaxID=3155304 RepID=UPI00344AC69F
MAHNDTSKVRRWDQHGREHVVRVWRTGGQRTLACGTCGWRRGAPFLPWLTAEEHLTQAHQATVDPTAPRRDRLARAAAVRP